MSTHMDINPNPLVRYLNKPSRDFTKADIIKYIKDNEIKMLNFRYIGGDGKLKTLNFVITSQKQLDDILSGGERVDGSSLFSYIDAKSSDLYVLPRYKTAFLDPFDTEIPTLNILCSYFDKDGNPLASAPENVMREAHKRLVEATGYTLNVMGELEYYVIEDRLGHYCEEHGEFESAAVDMYPAIDQRGYHESEPYAKFEFLRKEAMMAIAQAGGLIKYGHSEVGNFSDERCYYEQNEIEFMPTDMEDAADQLTIAKWIIRMLGHRNGLTVSFAPKITVGKAGSGMHIHMKLLKDGKAVVLQDGKLSDASKKAIAGILDISPALTAFGNTNPTSYLRLVPHQEAPTNICWGDRNRSTLIRVPLGWINVKNMIKQANPNYTGVGEDLSERQTFEFRCPDGSANIHLLLAGLATGVRHGMEMPNAIELADKLYVDVNIFAEENKARLEELETLPDSCADSADSLIKMRKIFEDNGFSPAVIDGTAKMLKAYNDKGLSERLYGKNDEIRALVNKHLHDM